MNFDLMPELHWQFGYAVSVVLMVMSSALPLYIFKKKGWIQ
jgi:magnesium transporter